MRRAFALVEQSCFAENERTGTYRRDVRTTARRSRNPAHDVTIEFFRLRVRHSRHDHQRIAGVIRQWVKTSQRHTMMRFDALARRADAHAIPRTRPVGFVESLQRPGQIENLDLRQDDEDYVADTSSSSAT